MTLFKRLAFASSLLVSAKASALHCPSLEWVNDSPLTGAALVVVDGNTQCTQTGGELKSGTPMPKNAVFNVASLAKPITVILTLQLVAEGKLLLDEPLAPYWVDPDLKGDERVNTITPHMLLTHSAGFLNWRYLDAQNTLTFVNEPGSTFKYSGEGFEYLKEALVRKFNRPFDELVNEYVFTPAGMIDSTLLWQNVKDQSRYALPHSPSGEPLDVPLSITASAADNLYTTAQDYGRFLQHLISFKKAQPTLFKTLIASHHTFSDKRAFALGFEKLTGISDEPILLHTGGDTGVSAIMMFYPQSNKGYAILLNSENPSLAFERLIPQMYLGKEIWQSR